jgi:ribA/ribD-fused uncharacterized protein
MARVITSFAGEYRFLSNFWPACVVLDGHSYRTVEHAYQAAKSLDASVRRRVAMCYRAADAKALGKILAVRPDWFIGDTRLRIMRDLLKQKFGTEPLRGRLLDTGSARLVEGNWWGDRYWGVCDGRGENHLGRLLMEIREELQRTAR